MAKWIQSAGIHKGGLHKSLGIAKNKPIPASDLEIKPGDSAKVKKQKNLAKTFRGFGVRKGK